MPMFFGNLGPIRDKIKFLEACVRCYARLFTSNRSSKRFEDLGEGFVEMTDENTTRTLQDFKHWRVPELKGFLRDRGLKVSGTKEELTALAYGAHQMNIPVKLAADEDRKRKSEAYEALLAVNECQLPDPLASPDETVSNSLKSPWLNEQVGMRKWPPVFQIQIAKFLLTADQSIGLESGY